MNKQKKFILTKKEAEKCRFKIVDQNLRLAECFVHQNHGVRLHPPHMYDLSSDGQLKIIVDKKKINWYSYIYAKNKERGNDNSSR